MHIAGKELHVIYNLHVSRVEEGEVLNSLGLQKYFSSLKRFYSSCRQ
jgi:hypothetical protein